MEQQQIKKKKKIDKRKEQLLMIDFNCLEDRQRKSYESIKYRIKEIFRDHIGSTNPITPYELFYSIFGINPQMISIFEREFYWNVLKRCFRELRKDEECFIINTAQRLYVLKTEEELNKYKKKIDRHVEDLKNLKIKATEWVKNEKWKKM